MIVKQFLESKHLPVVLAIIAIAIMLPALKTGLMMDDLVQRIPQLEPSQIPQELYRTGLVPKDPGELSTVLSETFGFVRNTEQLQKAADYGIFPWWFSKESRGSLWRPFTAFTHWVDYRVFPDNPALMHAHNISWFAVIVFLAAVIYRKIIGQALIAGLAALMVVLDPNTYFPVMFVANRGFMISLCFGLLCLYAHHKWRAEKSIPAALATGLFFALSLLSNEAGVSTFAFVLAYELVLDNALWQKRLVHLLPTISMIIIWRVVYQSLGYGVSGVGIGYLDPGHEPLKFICYFPVYFFAAIAGQLSSMPPDVMMGLNMHCCTMIFGFYFIFIIIAILIFLPVIRRDKMARFWFG
jgi:hypothetical protein